MSIISLENVTKEFPGVLAVDDVSFEVENGEFVTILGPSGSGKSTILRMVAGFESPSEGAIYVDGDDVTDDPPFERQVNMMFQDLALFPHLTVAENIAYGLKRQGIPQDERERRVADILEVVDLTGYDDRNPDQLSGGEQQRVALARAVVNEPKVVLFDEPLASLDRKLRQHMQFELQRIQEETGITFLYVTHDQEVAMSVSDRLVLLNQGDIEQIGTVNDLYDRPESQFVADFIGDVNIVPSTLVDVDDDEFVVEFDGSSRTLSRSAMSTEQPNWSPGQPVNLCVRPHEISIRNRASRNGALELQGEVVNRVYKGEQTTYRVETPETTFTINASDAEAKFDVGDPVYVAWPSSKTYAFAEEA